MHLVNRVQSLSTLTKKFLRSIHIHQVGYKSWIDFMFACFVFSFSFWFFSFKNLNYITQKRDRNSHNFLQLSELIFAENRI